MARARWKLDRKLTAMMVEDFIHNPVLAAKVILRLKIPAHQELRLLNMWTTHYVQDDSGFTTGKSFTLAIVCALRSVLFSERLSGIVSGTFRQSRLVFSNFDKWVNTAPIFANAIQVRKGQPRMTHGTEVWECFYTNDSITRALPPGFTDGERQSKLRSERWHDGYFDEWTTFSHRVLVSILFGRVTAVNKDPECPIRGNHMVLCSTPGVTSDPAYKQVEIVDSTIASGSKEHVRYTCNWRHISKKPEWAGFVDNRTIYTMQVSNPAVVVGSEIDGLWQDSTMTYYPEADVDARRVGIDIVHEKRLKNEDIYIGGFDTARGGAAKTRKKKSGDDFSFSVLRIKGGNFNLKPSHVYSHVLNGASSKEMAMCVHRIHNAFNMAAIVYDPGGGGLFVADELSEREILYRDEIIEKIPMVNLDDYGMPSADRVLIPFSRGSDIVKESYGYGMRSGSVLVNKMHESFKGAIDSNSVFLPSRWADWGKYIPKISADNMRNWLINNTTMDAHTRAKAVCDLAVEQVHLVDVERTKDMKPKIDSYGMFKFSSVAKKDVAYSLVYAYSGIGFYKKFVEQNGLSTSDSELACSGGTY